MPAVGALGYQMDPGLDDRPPLPLRLQRGFHRPQDLRVAQRQALDIGAVEIGEVDARSAAAHKCIAFWD